MKKLLIYLLLVNITVTLAAQQHVIDSIYSVLKTEKDDTVKVKNLITLGRLLLMQARYKETDSVTGVLKQLVLKYNDTLGITAYYKVCGSACYVQGNYQGALKNYVEALKLNEKLGNKQEIASICANIGSIYYSQGNYPQALENYLRALRLNEAAGNTHGICNAYVNIGVVHEAETNYSEALRYYNLALKEYEKSGDKDGIANVCGNMGNVYQELGNFDEALEAEQKSLELCRQLGYNVGMGIAYVNIGDAYEAKKDYSRAFDSYTHALKILEGAKHKRGMGYSYEGLGSVSIKLKKYQPAKAYLDSALTVSKQIGAKEVSKGAYNYLTKLDSATGDYKAALKDYKEFIAYGDSMKNEENTKKLVSEQMQYEFDKKQAEEKAIQDKKDADTAAANKRQQIITGSVSIGLLLVLIFSGLLLNRFRITRKQKMIIEEQKELVEQKNKEVVDSITYAKRLQDAILPPLSIIEKYLPESFVLYKPKDIVAGDFYWMEASPTPPKEGLELNSSFPLSGGQRGAGTIFIAAADCTGHGVPGAMVSVVCSNALNRAVKEFKITEPGKILDKVRELVLETFSQRDPFGERSESDVQDGMDISLCCINTQTKEVQWSGAYNSLWYIQNGDMKEIAGDKQPIGKTDNPKPFTTHTIIFPPNRGDKGGLLYLFTDGYADQFGGPKGKKFKYKQLQEKLLAMSHQPMEKQKQELEAVLEQWKGNLEQTDDICMVGIKV